MKRYSIFLLSGLLLININLLGQTESPIPEISKQLKAYFKSVPREKVYVTTDKDIYQPGETLWFNAVVENCSPELKSSELILKIYDGKGNTVTSDKYQLKNGTTYGDFELSESLLKGNYFLAAFTNLTTRPQDAYIQSFQINPMYHDDVQVQIIPSAEIATGGKEINFYILVDDLFGKPVEKQSMTYEIIDGNNVIEKGKLKTDEKGKANIQFQLPDRSSGKPLVLELSDRKNTWIEKKLIPSSLDQVNLTFYPEGGNIVSNIPVKIGFTTQNKWGQPIEVEGRIIDEQENLVSMVKSFLPGFGLFSFKAEPDKQYELILTSDIGKGQRFLIPKAESENVGFAVSKIDSEYIHVDIFAPQYENYQCALTVTGCADMSWAADLTVNKASRFKIPTKNISGGINQLSLFSKDGKPVAKRITYIEKQQQLNIRIDTKESVLTPGEISEFKILLTDQNDNPVQGNISLSIRDKFNVINENSLFKYLAINSNLKNQIDTIDMKKLLSSRVFDYILIANEMKSFSWEKIMQFDSTMHKGDPGISGMVIDSRGEPVPNAKVSLVHKRSIRFFTEAADEYGHFMIQGIDRDKKDEYVASATGPNGEKEFDLIFDRSFDEQLSEYVAHEKNLTLTDGSTGDVVNYLRANKALLSEKSVMEESHVQRKDNYKRYLENGVSILEIIKMMKPYNMTGNKIVFYGSQNSFNAQDGALIVIDGQKLGSDATVLTSLSPHDVESINVSTNPIDIQRYSGLNSVGLIEIQTKRAGGYVEKKSPPKLVEKLYKGEYRIPRGFTTPDKNSTDDYRTTLLWIPNIHIDQSGIAEISFPTSLVKSDFEIHVEGISVDGNLASQNAIIKVED